MKHSKAHNWKRSLFTLFAFILVLSLVLTACVPTQGLEGGAGGGQGQGGGGGNQGRRTDQGGGKDKVVAVVTKVAVADKVRAEATPADPASPAPVTPVFRTPVA
jgi:hypothetical protein